MEIKKAQDILKSFDEARGWGDHWNMKDLLLNITEEGGELWNLVKWIDEDSQKKIIAEKKNEASDYIGDMLFLVLKLANQMDVDAEKAFSDTLATYESRMPPEVMKKVGHANKFAGGVDNKEK